jgi:hypothetical protein
MGGINPYALAALARVLRRSPMTPPFVGESGDDPTAVGAAPGVPRVVARQNQDQPLDQGMRAAAAAALGGAGGRVVRAPNPSGGGYQADPLAAAGMRVPRTNGFAYEGRPPIGAAGYGDDRRAPLGDADFGYKAGEPITPYTIEAEPPNPTLTQRVNRQPNYPGDFMRESIRSGDPNVRRAALSDAGVPEQYQDLVNAGIPRPSIPDHSQDPHRGVWGEIGHRLKHAGKAGLLGLATGAGPLAAIDAVIGAASPKFADRMEYNLITKPRWEHDNAMNQQNAEAQTQRIKRIADVSGIDPVTGEPTPEATERYGRVQNIRSEMSDRVRRRAYESDKLDVDRLDQFIKASQPGATVPREVAEAAGLPDLAGQPIYKTPQGEHYVRGADGTTYHLRGGAGSVVSDDQGRPIKQYVPPPPREPATPEYVYQGQAIGELLKEKGVTDPNALVDNPAFGDAMEQARRANADDVAQLGDVARMTEEQLARQVAKKVPRKVKAGSLLSDAEVKQRAAGIYRRGRSSGPTSRSGSTRRQPRMAANQAETEYQSLYPRLSPEDRAALEDAFKSEYGRLPRKPGGAR